MRKKAALIGFPLLAMVCALVLSRSSAWGACINGPCVPDIGGDDPPPCKGSSCDPSPPTSTSAPPPPPLSLACGVTGSGSECRVSSATIPACTTAANVAFDLVVNEQAGARIDPTLTQTNNLGIAYVDRGGGIPSFIWKPAFSTKKTYCGTVFKQYTYPGGIFWGAEVDENVQVSPSAAFEPIRSVAAALMDNPSSDGYRCDSSQPSEVCLEDEITQPVISSPFMPGNSMTHCAFGPVVNDHTAPRPHGGRPEIHPMQAQWWAPSAGSRWLIKGSQDGSERFTGDNWGAPRPCSFFFTCDPPPDSWRNFSARAFRHGVEIAFEVDMSGAQGARFDINTLEDDNTGLTPIDALWGTGQDRGSDHDLIVDGQLRVRASEGSQTTSHVDLRDVCRNGSMLRGYVRVAFITGSFALLEDGSRSQYGRKTIEVTRGVLGGPPPPRSRPPRPPRETDLGSRKPYWKSRSIYDDVGVRQDYRSWLEGYRLVAIESERAGRISFRKAEPTRASEWIDAATLPEFDLLQDRGRLKFTFSNGRSRYAMSAGSNPPRPNLHLVREKPEHVVEKEAARTMVRLAGGDENAWEALLGLYDVVRYASLDLHVKPGYLDADTEEGASLSGKLNDALGAAPQDRVRVFGSETPFAAAWLVRAFDAETHEALRVVEGPPDGSPSVFIEPGGSDEVTERATLRVHFPDRKGRIVDVSVQVTLKDPAGNTVTREFELMSHVGKIRAAADWEALSGPLGSLAAAELDQVPHDAGLLNGTAERATLPGETPARSLYADALWTLASRTGLARSRLDVNTLKKLIGLARDYGRRR